MNLSIKNISPLVVLISLVESFSYSVLYPYIMQFLQSGMALIKTMLIVPIMILPVAVSLVIVLFLFLSPPTFAYFLGLIVKKWIIQIESKFRISPIKITTAITAGLMSISTITIYNHFLPPKFSVLPAKGSPPWLFHQHNLHLDIHLIYLVIASTTIALVAFVLTNEHPSKPSN
jgi:hypothetical protein